MFDIFERSQSALEKPITGRSFFLLSLFLSVLGPGLLDAMELNRLT